MDSKCYLGKLPVHLAFLDTLVEVFPDARLIFTYRPLTQMVASRFSLAKHNCGPIGIDTTTDQWKKRQVKKSFYFCDKYSG